MNYGQWTRRAVALLFIVLGMLLSILYPYTLYFMGDEVALKVIKGTLAFISIVLGSLIAAIGVVLLVGLSRYSD